MSLGVLVIDCICVIGGGRVMEQGGHDDLMHKQGAYYHLVKAQEVTGCDEDATSASRGVLIRLIHFRLVRIRKKKGMKRNICRAALLVSKMVQIVVLFYCFISGLVNMQRFGS